VLFQTSGSYQDFRDKGLLFTKKYWTKSSWWLRWNDYFKGFTVIIMIRLTRISVLLMAMNKYVQVKKRFIAWATLFLSGDHDIQSLVLCVVCCSPLFVIIVFVLMFLAIVLFVLSLKPLNVICKCFCLAVTIPKIQGVEIGPKFKLSKKSHFSPS
jgi:hypothetical protein